LVTIRHAMLVLAAVAILLAILVVHGFRADMREARARISSGATGVVSSPFGPIEFDRGGEGPPVLVVHGGGGGFDQGELIARAVLPEGVSYIAPSRFGYLGSGAPPHATYDDQADAFAWLLDELEVESVAVVAMSAGGAAGLLLALRHPERVSSLTLLSAGVAPVTTETQADADVRGSTWVRLSRHDFPYWAMSRFFRRFLVALMGADSDTLAHMNETERDNLFRVIDYMNPMSPRYEGAVLDNQTPLPGERIAAIGAPTLVVHAEDDTLQLFENALFAGETIPGARLLRFERGGHLVMIVEEEAIRMAVGEHITRHLPPR
jgi:2-hydroxy-6-oxonona-2,4-dienedioate hydrolase